MQKMNRIRKMMKLVIASDHAGFELKQFLIKELSDSYEIINLGTNSLDSVDYPDFGKKLADVISSGDVEFGILICGSGIGISIAANRNPKVRAALCYNREITKLARQHNDANVISLGARFLEKEEALELCKIFLTTKFEGGRHSIRVNKLSC